MTTFTQAQINAALRAANKVRLGAGDDRAQMEAALIAAAGVEKWPMNTLTSRQGEMLDAERAATNQKDLARYIQTIGMATEARTIERCAQVADEIMQTYEDELTGPQRRRVGATIRALKDEP
jgi:hypothetical protein